MESSQQLERAIKYLESIGIFLPEGYISLCRYGDSPGLERELIDLIKGGSKRGTASLKWEYELEQEQIPVPGDLEIVLNSDDMPELVTRILSAAVVPFCEVSAAHAAIEGEGDRSLKHWTESHWLYFSRACKRLGYTASQDMPIVCTEFEVLHVIPRNPTQGQEMHRLL
ncbi:MAG: ASCH domain-containing protein [Gammaproteobacteria bacterium]|jgi:uncharacterized protein YhfF|nr:ASCH domain-containing protein [Gammaproteobacteria bacterium]MDP6535950.1 ASCH domain-containing protein [Gammaproteobacteria bacterium]MDP6734284.1 ASCH domain-containing protein [Gammaproteobacteria bacterium]HAJ76742.1 RNA-binding protein [Gammaproteobacteria bacterium]|tara:strand:- start:2403 stop:2909 length:507 start_codon:yes stop_codon:yes gene_type:complete